MVRYQYDTQERVGGSTPLPPATHSVRIYPINDTQSRRGHPWHEWQVVSGAGGAETSAV